MLNKAFQYFYNPTCLCCGSFFVEDHLFCTFCFDKKIEPRLELKKNQLPVGISPYSIFDWKPGESDLLSEMVYRMKSDRCLRAWNYYALLAVRALNFEADLTKIDYIIPVPGSRKSSVHSYIFSELIGDFLKKPVLSILVKNSLFGDIAEQKSKSHLERKLSTIQVCEQITNKDIKHNLKNSKILLIDDIVTTGSSFKQALDALGKPDEPLFLTLFYRTKNT